MEKMGGTRTYTGCLAAGAEAGTFTLTHAVADDHMGKDALKNDAMKNDTLSVSSKSVDLGKHVGHKVSVTGSSGADKMDSNGMSVSVFTVKSLKMVSASCS